MTASANPHRLVPAPEPLQGRRPHAAQAGVVRAEIMVLAIRDAVVEVRVGLGIVAVGAMQFMQVCVREKPASYSIPFSSAIDSARRSTAPSRRPRTRACASVVAARLCTARHAESDREFLGALGERDDDVQTPEGKLMRGEAGVCRREFRRGAERFQDGDGSLDCGEDLVAAAQPPQRRRHPLERVAFAEAVSSRPPVLQRPPVGGLGIGPAIDHRQLPGRELDPAGCDAAGARRLRSAARVRTARQLRDGMPACERDDPPTQHAPGQPGRRRPLRRERPAGHHRHSRECVAPAVSEHGVRNVGPARPPARSPDARSRAGSANRMVGHQSRRDDLGQRGPDDDVV